MLNLFFGTLKRAWLRFNRKSEPEDGTVDLLLRCSPGDHVSLRLSPYFMEQARQVNVGRFDRDTLETERLTGLVVDVLKVQDLTTPKVDRVVMIKVTGPGHWYEIPVQRHEIEKVLVIGRRP